ncbi:retrovirus-related Pol polyprotein from transposon TNT 1-94 [Trichonephila clavipes]|nr:retrovirus-related Pol polyprotein from transposon TNT 1-94 [Trichonephila clavipes]
MEAAGVERIQLLNKSNWNSWKENMKCLLIKRGCWSFIEGTETPLDETTAPRRDRSVLSDVGHALNDMYCAFQAIRALSPEFQGIVQILYHWPNEDFKLDKIEIELCAEENQLKQLKNDSSQVEFTDNSVSAYAICKFKQHNVSENFKPKPDANKSKFKKSKIKDKIGPCYLCTQEGHLKRNCKYLNPNSSKFSASNLNYCCEEKGKNESFVTETHVNEVTEEFNWIIDTAATRHLCNTLNLFSHLRNIEVKTMSLAVGEL